MKKKRRRNRERSKKRKREFITSKVQTPHHTEELFLAKKKVHTPPLLNQPIPPDPRLSFYIISFFIWTQLTTHVCTNSMDMYIRFFFHGWSPSMPSEPFSLQELYWEELY
jgi:hypothetical protein